MPPRVNYDEIAPLYDEPLRDKTVDRNLLAFLDDRAGTVTASDLRILDIGCGTGKQLTIDRAQFPDMTMVGVDHSDGMLRIAHTRCRSVIWVQGDGMALPLRASTFQYATNQFSYPHIADPRRLLTEAFRVLMPRGRFVMTNIDPWSMPGWLVYRYFPQAWDLDRRDFMPLDTFAALMSDVRFEDVRAKRTDVSREQRLSDFLAYASGRHRASQFMAIPDDSYEAGLKNLRRDIANAREPDPIVKSDLVLVTVTGQRP